MDQEGGVAESSRVRREREDENAGGGTPSKKRRQGGRSEGAEGGVSGKVAAKAGEGGSNGVGDGSGERSGQESAGGGGDGVDASGAGEGASRGEAGAVEVYRIPSYAAWFQWDKVHPLERRAMSEFFDKRSSAKTPRIYKEYRDFIINKYRENPKQALTFAEVRRMVIGDVNSLSRVFDFLEHWGLINQQVAGDQGAAEGAGPVVSVMDSFPSGINVVRMPVASGARIPGIATFESSGRLTPVSHGNNLSTHKNVYSPGSKKHGSVSTVGSKKSEDESHCSLCKKDCAKQHYYRKQQPGSNFCLDCVKKGKLPAGTSASDLVQVSGNDPTVTVKEWTSKETLLLLEAISRFGENWNQVAAHVPTRSKLECVNHFIQLPFGDSYCVEPEEPTPPVVGAGGTPTKNAGQVGASTEEAVLRNHTVANGAVPSVSPTEATPDAGGSEDAGGAQELVSPFTDTSHPLFAQVALLAGMVGPRVAAAAARAAVVAIAEDEPGVTELPFMQSSKTHSGQKRQAGQAMQSRAERLTEESDDALQFNGEGCTQGEQPRTQDASLPSNDPDASKLSEEDGLPSAAQARISVATALGVAAANAKLLADQEEQEIEHLVASVIDNQMKKLYSKLKHFEELEMLLEKERLEVERARQQVYADRLRYAEAQTAMAKPLFRNPAPS
ncbi:hypothetical protein M758_9G042700 [Ceratodon purpureus]|nr:hypothetical protein M758_9G042700 [Ceratodon purpureus]